MKLKNLSNTVVNTKTQQEYDELMEICERGGWKWCDGRVPTDDNCWVKYKENTCVKACDYLTYSPINYFKGEGYQIISLQEFKREQGMAYKVSSNLYDSIPISGAVNPTGSGAYYDFLNTFFTAPKVVNNKNKIMSVIKNIFKTKERKALEHYNIVNGDGGLTSTGQSEFVDYLYETLKEERNAFIKKIIEAYKEEK